MVTSLRGIRDPVTDRLYTSQIFKVPFLIINMSSPFLQRGIHEVYLSYVVRPRDAKVVVVPLPRNTVGINALRIIFNAMLLTSLMPWDAPTENSRFENLPQTLMILDTHGLMSVHFPKTAASWFTSPTRGLSRPTMWGAPRNIASYVFHNFSYQSRRCQLFRLARFSDWLQKRHLIHDECHLKIPAENESGEY